MVKEAGLMPPPINWNATRTGRVFDMAGMDELMRLARRLRLASGEGVQPLQWRPAADVYRTDDGWLVKFELAGVDPELPRLVAGLGLETLRQIERSGGLDERQSLLREELRKRFIP